MLYEKLLRPLLFRMDPERAHEMTVSLLDLCQKIPGAPGALRSCFSAPGGLQVKAFGLEFPNPVGLAAGFDKDCRLAGVLPSLGFGFLELGSVTLRPQPGNSRPRVFRIPEAEAVVNRLGFNSSGAAAAAGNLASLRARPVPIGVNLGLNADCPRERAAEEYAATFKILEPHGDYFAVNVSSPNTAGLRDLQQVERLEKILGALQAANKKGKPILVKISPDLSDGQLKDVVTLIQKMAAGVIATNTTLSREGVPGAEGLQGGLSGAPLRRRATELIADISRLAGGRLPIIGVGGISSGKDVLEKIAAGACLVQLYTGLIYRGPGAVAKILRELGDLRT
ncbi:MAG: quinone-dependent dihydroorotate dehydrogenase [Elusimicrobia bacterium]|nr:quinone-dependent dihydroorotate dehydrogenase [Elusimicrobiota bacterium]